MLNLPVSKINNVQTMSSRDLAVLCLGDKKDSHSNFVIKMNKVLSELDILNFQDIYFDSQNRKRLFYNLPEREACLMAMSYSYELQAKVYDAWQELKAQPSLPTTKQLALMVIKAEEEKEAALLEVDRIQGICQTITAQFKVGMTPAKFCKQLNGVNVQKVNKTLVELNKLYADGKGYSPTSVARDDLFKANYGDFSPYPSLLKNGAKWLYRAYLGGKLPMKNTWDGVFVHVVFTEE